MSDVSYFAIMATDVANSTALRATARPAHIDRLKTLTAESRLLVAGPHPASQGEGFTGSLVIASFESLEDAQAWANSDPYVEAGVYANVVVKPYKPVLP